MDLFELLKMLFAALAASEFRQFLQGLSKGLPERHCVFVRCLNVLEKNSRKKITLIC
jgi:hypothetical protein